MTDIVLIILFGGASMLVLVFSGVSIYMGYKKGKEKELKKAQENKKPEERAVYQIND